jgi:transglutaminase-like putative cysteine protease
LYIAGLCVTLSGLYAVNYGSPDQNFTMLTFGLAACGYLVSYTLRVKRIAIQTIQTPLMVVLGLVFLAMLSSDRGLGWLAPAGIEEDRARILQFIFAWLAIIHSFLLSNDAAVLFACVPCMTMLALVSTRNSDQEVQNAFLTFIGASTFMMVHENYLRTRQSQLQGRFSIRDRRLFGGQLQLTAICLIGALALANFVAVPIRTVGQTLFDSGALSNTATKVVTMQKLIGGGASAGEQSEIDLGNGPVSDSEVAVMKVVSPTAMNWRGKTFGVYTGMKFINSEIEEGASTVNPIDDGASTQDRNANEYVHSDAPTFQAGASTFEVPPNALEMPGVDHANRETVTQTITVLGLNSLQVYGAGCIRKLIGPFSQLTSYVNGSLLPIQPVPQNASYTVVSDVAKEEDPQRLRAASSAPEDIPAEIAKLYLETRVWNRDTRLWSPESPLLRSIVTEIVHGQANHFDRAQAIAAYIRANCLYTLKPKPTPPDKDAVEYFLTEQKRGYCTSFAAAMTMLARYAGIPARFASGYLAGEKQPDGSFLVRDKQKHVWAELFFPRIGWVPFDATEGAADVPDEDRKGAKRPPTFMAWFFSHGWFPPVTGLMIVALFGYLLKTEVLDRIQGRRSAANGLLEFPPTNFEIISAYLTACDLMKRRGLPRLNYQTALEYNTIISQRTANDSRSVGALMNELTGLFMRFRYGIAVADEADVSEAQAALNRLKTELGALPRNVFANTPRSSAGGSRDDGAELQNGSAGSVMETGFVSRVSVPRRGGST